MEDISLYNKLANLPENLKSEVADFIDFLLSKSSTKESTQTSIRKPKFGSAKGMFKVNANFDEPLEDFKDYTTP